MRYTYDELVKVSFDLNKAVSKRLTEEGTGVFRIYHMFAHAHQHV